MSKIHIFAFLAFLIAFGAFFVTPNKVEAGDFEWERVVDPLCLFHSCYEPPVYKYQYTNSNNVNSNINSPGAVVNNNAPTVVNSTDTYASGGAGYTYPPTTPYNPPPQYYEPVNVSCYPSTTYANIGETVRWTASPTGGNGNYSYSWSGDHGLSGSGYSTSKSYNTPGYKNARVTVTSNGQSVTRNCDSGVNVYPDYEPYDPYYPPYNYDDISVSCSADDDSVKVGESVRWRAEARGGYGDYRYYWDGSEGLSGTGSSVRVSYEDTGTKYAQVTVYSGGYSVSERCDDTVRVTRDTRYDDDYYYPPVVYPPYYPPVVQNLDIGCFADPAKITVNNSATWIAEVTGGRAPYTYSWSGTDGLTGNASSIVKYYSAAGSKSAVVTVTSADGKTGSRTCTNTLTVSKPSTYTKPAAKPTTTTVVKQTEQTQVASSIWSLRNIPWGWVAILVILVLFVTVIYLLFNRQKI